jgi:hypothetical protein
MKIAFVPIAAKRQVPPTLPSNSSSPDAEEVGRIVFQGSERKRYNARFPGRCGHDSDRGIRCFNGSGKMKVTIFNAKAKSGA